MASLMRANWRKRRATAKPPGRSAWPKHSTSFKSATEALRPAVWGHRTAEILASAPKWHSQDCSHGCQFGICCNGRGDWVAKDSKEAIKWLRKSAEGGNAQAQALLGNFYVQGRDVAQDWVQGYTWLSLSVAQEPKEDPKDQERYRNAKRARDDLLT